MFKRILVPLDGSASAEEALSHAQGLARRFGSEVVLLHVIAPEAWIPFREDDTPLPMDQVEKVLDRASLALAEAGVGVSVAVTRGEAAGEIVEFARQAGADLIVMSPYGFSSVSRWHLGTVAEKVVWSTELPVLLVRQD